jgi:hypothetical protein
MENKNESKIWEKDEALSKEPKKVESPEIFETNDDNLEKAKEIENEGKQETTGKEVNEGKIETKEFNQFIEDVNKFNESFEVSKTEKPKIFDRFKGLLSKKETADQRDYEKLSQDISKRVFEYGKVNPDILNNDSIKEFLEKAKEIANERADRVDKKIEGLNKQTAEEIEKVNKERPGLFDKISERFNKNGLEIVIALGLLAMLAAMPREALLDKIASGDVGMQINTLLSQLNLPQIHSFLPAKYANLALIASTAAVLRVAKSDFLTRNIKKYFGSNDLKEEVIQEEEKEPKETEDFDVSSREEVVEKKDTGESFNQVAGSAEHQETFKKYQEGELDSKGNEKVDDNDMNESFNQVAGSTEYQEAFKKYQEGELNSKENEKIDDNDMNVSFNQVAGSAEYQEAFKKYQEGELDDEEKKEAGDDMNESFNQVAGSAEYQEAFKKYQEGKLDNEEMKINKEELEMLNTLKEMIAKGEKVEVKYKKGLDWEFGWYVTDIKEKKGKRPSVSLKRFQGNDAKYINVDLSKIELAKKKY